MNKVVTWRERSSHGFTTPWQDGDPSGLHIPLHPEYSIELAYAIPDTHCVVPREATEAMVFSANRDWKTPMCDQTYRDIYKAMLNAAEVGE